MQQCSGTSEAGPLTPWLRPVACFITPHINSDHVRIAPRRGRAPPVITISMLRISPDQDRPMRPACAPRPSFLGLCSASACRAGSSAFDRLYTTHQHATWRVPLFAKQQIRGKRPDRNVFVIRDHKPHVNLVVGPLKARPRPRRAKRRGEVILTASAGRIGTRQVACCCCGSLFSNKRKRQ
jgi:hypothetical protein